MSKFGNIISCENESKAEYQHLEISQGRDILSSMISHLQCSYKKEYKEHEKTNLRENLDIP